MFDVHQLMNPRMINSIRYALTRIGMRLNVFVLVQERAGEIATPLAWTAPRNYPPDQPLV